MGPKKIAYEVLKKGNLKAKEITSEIIKLLGNADIPITKKNIATVKKEIDEISEQQVKAHNKFSRGALRDEENDFERLARGVRIRGRCL